MTLEFSAIQCQKANNIPKRHKYPTKQRHSNQDGTARYLKQEILITVLTRPGKPLQIKKPDINMECKPSTNRLQVGL